MDDFLSGNDGYVEAGTEHESLLVNTAGVTFYGFWGDDVVVGSAGKDTIVTGDGIDTV
jgi:hypothetical protein